MALGCTTYLLMVLKAACCPTQGWLMVPLTLVVLAYWGTDLLRAVSHTGMADGPLDPGGAGILGDWPPACCVPHRDGWWSPWPWWCWHTGGLTSCVLCPTQGWLMVPLTLVVLAYWGTDLLRAVSHTGMADGPLDPGGAGILGDWPPACCVPHRDGWWSPWPWWCWHTGGLTSCVLCPTQGWLMVPLTLVVLTYWGTVGWFWWRYPGRLGVARDTQYTLQVIYFLQFGFFICTERISVVGQCVVHGSLCWSGWLLSNWRYWSLWVGCWYTEKDRERDGLLVYWEGQRDGLLSIWASNIAILPWTSSSRVTGVSVGDSIAILPWTSSSRVAGVSVGDSIAILPWTSSSRMAGVNVGGEVIPNGVP